MGYRSLLLFLFFSLSPFASAQKKFVSSYLSFDTQRNWDCQKFGFSWLCHHKQSPKTQPALIVIFLRMIPEETAPIQSLMARIKQHGAHRVHQIHQAGHLIQEEMSSIKQHDWMKRFLRNKWAMRFFNRSVFTVCCKESEKKFYIFVGFHAPGTQYSFYSFEFKRAINSLDLKTDLKTLIAQYRHDQQTKHNREMMSHLQRMLMGTDEDYYPVPAPARKKSKDIRLLVAFSAVALLLLYALWPSSLFTNKKRRRKSLQRGRRRSHSQKRHRRR